MTIKAILRDGRIQPLEPLPPDWTDGQELVVEEPDLAGAKIQVDQWAKDLETATARLPAEEHDRFRRALGEIERESKDAIRREWGLP
ncbi:MAG: hypothetical protein ABSB33_00415 [Tepidisphaeraceae bacterium]|jgi:hypothetical protein